MLSSSASCREHSGDLRSAEAEAALRDLLGLGAMLEVGERHPAPGRGEAQRGLAPDADARPRDEDALASEVGAHDLMLPGEATRSAPPRRRGYASAAAASRWRATRPRGARPPRGYDATMNVLVVGATGRTGRLLARGALERGHAVTALVRAPEKLGDLAGRVRVVAGDVLDGGIVSDAVDGQDAVLVALSAAHRKSAPAVNALGTLNVIRSMQRYGVRRLIVLSASGTQPGRDPNLPWVFERVLKPVLLGPAYDDLRRMETSVRQSELDWTIVRVSGTLTRRPGSRRLPRRAGLLAPRRPPHRPRGRGRVHARPADADGRDRPRRGRRLLRAGPPAAAGRRLRGRLAAPELVAQGALELGEARSGSRAP